MSPVIRPETPEDADAVRAVHLAAFPDEPVVAEIPARLRAREAPLPCLGVVAAVDAAVVGHVQLSHGWLDARERLVDLYVLSPLAVHPGHQRARLGGALVRAALDAAAAAGVPYVVLEGDPGYYRRHGFVPGVELGLRRPSLRIPEPACQAVALPAREGWMTGTIVYPEVFWALDAVGLRDPELAQVERALGAA
jgi:putative acetyltransferase